MVAQNKPETRDAFATALVKLGGLTLRDLQVALELCAKASLALDVVLLETKAVTHADIVKAAAASDFVLTAEQAAVPQITQTGERSFARHSTNLAVQFKDWKNLELVYANNISRGGLGLTVPLGSDVPPINTVLSLALSLPDGQTIELKGLICYCRDGIEHRHIGIQLHHEQTEVILQIDKLIRLQA